MPLVADEIEIHPIFLPSQLARQFIDKMIKVAKDPRFGNTKAMLLFETPQDALRAIEGGVDIKELNIGFFLLCNNFSFLWL